MVLSLFMKILNLSRYFSINNPQSFYTVFHKLSFGEIMQDKKGELDTRKKIVLAFLFLFSIGLFFVNVNPITRHEFTGQGSTQIGTGIIRFVPAGGTPQPAYSGGSHQSYQAEQIYQEKHQEKADSQRVYEGQANPQPYQQYTL